MYSTDSNIFFTVNPNDTECEVTGIKYCGDIFFAEKDSIELY